VLFEFAGRYFECNPHCIFGSTGKWPPNFCENRGF
jgi:hypothetical protein